MGLSIRRPLLVAVAAVLLALALGALIFEILPDLFAPERSRGFGKAAEAAARSDVRTSALQFLGGLVIALGALFTARNIQLTQERNRIEHEGQITERFTRAIDQLGSRELDIRLGGIYALERIARDSPADHGPIVEVLTAFVREHASASPDFEEDEEPEEEVRPPTDVQAVLTVLGRRNDQFDPSGGVLDLRAADLVGADLTDASMARANLTGTRLHHATLNGVGLSGARLAACDLRNAALEQAQLQRAGLHRAHLEGAYLAEADLTRARMYRAHLTDALLESAQMRSVGLREARAHGAFFTDADLHRAQLHGAQLQDADFSGAKLDGANLRGAGLEGAILTGASLTGARLVGATFDARTRWPEDFDPIARGARRSDV